MTTTSEVATPAGIVLKPGTTDLRLLTTGSRKYPTPAQAVQARRRIFWALDTLRYWVRTHPDLRTFTVVHGAAREGGDATVHAWCEINAAQGLIEETHPAGDYPHPLLRNTAMIELGAHLLLASLAPCMKPGCARPGAHGSHGTSYTMRHAELAGIDVWDISP